MGCQLESQGAALQELQKTFASKGVLLCGVDRIEHPYDVEDYLRHFGFSFPVFVDMSEESPPVAGASLGSIAILDRDRHRVRLGGKNQFEPEQAKAALEKVVASLPSRGNGLTNAPRVLRPSPDGRKFMPPRMAVADWSEPTRLGTGKYPRIVSLGGGRAVCVWVTGEVPQQQLEYGLYSAGRWTESRPVPAGQDAHAVAADVNADGRAVIVWSRKDAEGYRIYLSTWLGDKWQEPVAISPAGQNVFRPDVFCLPSDASTPSSSSSSTLSSTACPRTVVAWYGWKRVKLRNYPNAWWRSTYVCEIAENKPGVPCELAELRRGSDDCWDPVITGTGKDLWVSWLRDENPPKLWASANRGSAWSAPESLLRLPGVGTSFRVQAASPIRAARSRPGVVFEMFSLGGPGRFRAGTHVYMTRLRENGWTDPVPLCSLPGRHVAPVGVEVAGEKLLLFWCNLPGQGKSSTILMREANAGAEDRVPERFAITSEGSNSYPSVAADSAGLVWLAWQSEEANAAQAIYVSFWRSVRR